MQEGAAGSKRGNSKELVPEREETTTPSTFAYEPVSPRPNNPQTCRAKGGHVDASLLAPSAGKLICVGDPPPTS